MYFGACYYPEHWPEERWVTDASMMKEAGFNMVRIGEFAWSRLERREGEYDLSWLDRSIDILSSYGIQVTLGTPSATPPKWLMDKHPDIYMRDYYGRVKGFGNRRHYCYNNENYHQYIRVIVQMLAEQYATHSNVVAWQIDNEFGCNDTTRCYCDNCLIKFQDWLRIKYTHIDNLNDSWGTVFWSQIYNDFEEVILPGYTVFPLHNPGLVLDYRRFASDSVRSFQKIQVDILKKIVPHQQITHNLMGAFNEIDYYDLSEDLDFISWDNYPNLVFTTDVNPALPAMQHDMTRSLKQMPFWVMEHQSGQPGGNIMFRTPKPLELRRWTYQSIARGADGILYFRWRGCLFGAEQYWHGILQHDGKAGRKYKEVQQVGQELSRISTTLQGTNNKSQVAMIRSYDVEWTFEIQPHMLEYTYMNHFIRYYQYFYNHHIQVDVVSPDVDFSAYRVLVLPNFIMAQDGMIARLYEFVRSGGVVIMDYRAGAKDWFNRMEPLTLPGKFSELLGITVSEYGIIASGQSRSVQLCDKSESYKATTWFDVIHADTAVPLATFSEDYYSGCPVVTVNQYGQGKSYYIGAELEEGLLDHVLNNACLEANVEHIHGIKVPNGVELIRRSDDKRQFVFVINHNEFEVSIQLESPFYELLSSSVLGNSYSLEGNGVILLTKGEVAL